MNRSTAWDLLISTELAVIAGILGYPYYKNYLKNFFKQNNNKDQNGNNNSSAW